MSITKYYCRNCGERKQIPERLSDANRTINAGCESCARIVTFKQLGVR